DGAVHDGERVEDGEDALRAAGEVDEAGRSQHVGGDVRVGEPAEEAPLAEQEDGDQRGEVEPADDRVEPALDPARERLRAQREHRGGDQQRGPHQQPDAGEEDELAVEVRRLRLQVPHRGYLIEPAMEKMGRYMAMRKPPTTNPRNTIMIGSIMLVRAATAASTSSS